MANEKIKEWIQKKLEEGVEKDRIRKSLKNTGHDPHLIEEVENSADIGDDPFQEDSENVGEESSSDEMEMEFSSRVSSDNEEEKEDSGPSIPGFTLPNLNFNRKALAVLGGSLLIVLGMAGVFSYIEDSGVTAPQCSGEEGAGVKVYGVSSQDGVTTAQIRVVEEVPVILEVFSSGEKIGQRVKTTNGRGSISVDEVGNSISFHEYGCDDPSVERNY